MRINEEKVRDIALRMLIKEGVPEENAKIVSDTLVCADRRGIHTHGVGKIGDYLDRIKAGVLDSKAQPKVEKRSPVAIYVDGQNGFGQVGAYRAMEEAINSAKVFGIGLAVVGNSNHFGIASYYSMMAANQGMIGLCMTNASPGIAPFGAREVLYGTNPMSFAIPSKSKFPIVLDMSSSVVARGKIRQALQKNQQLQPGWARDEKGQPTTDPKAALKGSLEPVGGPKGSGLALIIEVLCGVLSGCTMPGEVLVIKNTSGPCKTSHLMIAIDPTFFIGREAFAQKIDLVIDMVKGLTPIADAVYLPGELEAMEQERCDEGGIDLSSVTIEMLTKFDEENR